MTIDVLLL